MVQVCGLWANEDKNGNIYWSGTIGNANILIFENNKKEKESHPDFNLCIAPRKFKKKDDMPGQNDIPGQGEMPYDDTPF